MQNLFENLRSGLHYNKFILDELMGVEYSCPIPDEELGIWTQTDYILHVLSGKKSWRTLQGTVEVNAGDTVYIKKGAAFVRQFFDDDFCMLIFFIKDDFIRATLEELKGKISFPTSESDGEENIMQLKDTPLLSAFFQGMLHHFGNDEQPADSLLELKFKELLLSILTSSEYNKLSAYFKSFAQGDLPSLPFIMEQNFSFNLSMEEFAKLCHRSLSSFKREFQNCYHTSPGKWLLAKRLDHAAMLLHDESSNISQVAYESGFEDSSHFSRTFKDRFNQTPLNYRNEQLKAAE
jgi:AraC-like DNA-binding protein